MADNSGIEWTNATWNPLVGCSKISQGCKNCYAEVMAKRLAAMGQRAYQSAVDERGHWNGRVVLVPAALEKPLGWKKPRMIFVNSMSDLFHDDVPESYIEQVFAVMMKANWHTFQVLTKRAGRMAEILSRAAWWSSVEESARRHIWLGVSVEDQKAADERVPALVQVPAAVRFLSCEPLLGRVDLELRGRNYGAGDAFVNWVICGGESGPRARAVDADWVRYIRDQCVSDGVAFFFKQWGEHNTEGVKCGKKRAGRLLDGVEWSQFPEVV